MIEWLRSVSEVRPSGRGFGGAPCRGFALSCRGIYGVAARILGVVSRNLRCRGEDFRCRVEESKVSRRGL